MTLLKINCMMNVQSKALTLLVSGFTLFAAIGNAAWFSDKQDSYSASYASGTPPNSAEAAGVYFADEVPSSNYTTSPGATRTAGSAMSGMPDRKKLRSSAKLQNSFNGKLGVASLVGRGWLWGRRPAPAANAAQQFSSYSAVHLESSGQEYIPSQTFRPEDYLTDPPPGLVPTDDPIELWLSAGVGRFGDHEFELLGGTPSEPTPVGTFSVIKKDSKYWSRKYDAAMPYSVFFKEGYALHYGALDQPSHGCVHLPYETSQRLYYCTKVGRTKVIIHP